jgi:hypothetical protein
MSKVLQKYFNPEAIKLAFYRVQCWPEKIVKDQVGLRAFGADLHENCSLLSKKLMEGTYKPQVGFKFYLPKSSLTNRTKTLLFIEDAIVYQAIANQLAVDSYDLLNEHESFVFGSVLTKETKDGVTLLNEEKPIFFFFKFWKNLFQQFKDSIIQSIEVHKVKYKFETDITGFFDCIPHYNLLSTLSETFGVEDEILDLLSQCLNTWSGTKDSITPGVGIPQGPLPSYLLANMILYKLDELLIGKGFKYYRYMDDIKIYGYEYEDLLSALVLIDKNLKGNGLSINSKKTSIEEIKEGEEDATLKELKKIDTFSFTDINEELLNYNSITLEALLADLKKEQKSVDLELDSEDDESKLSSKELKNVSGLLEQESHDIYNITPNTILKTEEEIVEFWKNKISEVEQELPELFIESEETLDNLELKEGISDIDFIRLSVQYGVSFRNLKEYKNELSANQELLKYWLFAYKKYFWRANNFGLTLSIYSNNKEIKSFLLELYSGLFKHYEWARFMAIQTMSLNNYFEDRELRQVFFKFLKEEDSDLVKVALYRLLYKHSTGKQFVSTLNKQLQLESSWYLKVLISDFNKYHLGKEIDIVEFLNSIGL